jgi:nucleotide-binding universal stress UspA family protein
MLNVQAEAHRPQGQARQAAERPALYKRILLAYDGSLKGRAALSRVMLLAQASGAQVFLLSVVEEGFGLLAAESANAGVVGHLINQHQAILDDGLVLLERAAIAAGGKVVSGEPTLQIADYACRMEADLVVVSHRKRSLMERWWMGTTGSYLADHLTCSLLIVRDP